MIEPGDDLASIIYNNIIDNNIKIDDGDVIAVAQKVISKSENRYRSLDEIVPSEDAKELANQIDKDPQFVQAVLDESAKVLRYRHNVLIVEHKLGFVHANAGIDRSNINQTTNKVLLLPKDPDASAGQIGNFLSDKLKKNISVIVTDTMGRPFRNGIVGFAIGSFNLEVIRDERGKVDLFDKGILNAEGKDVVVIGGGDTAMDCVRTSVRQKANSVKCLYRRDKDNMPGSAREVANAEEEGVEFVWLSSPKEFRGKNKIEKLIVDQIQLGDPDDSGRRRPEIKQGSEFEIKADMVIKALGFDPENLPLLFEAQELQVTKWGTIKTDFDTMETNIKGVFAAGDIVRGASLVVWAIKDGRDAALSIKSYLENIELKKSKVA